MYQDFYDSDKIWVFIFYTLVRHTYNIGKVKRKYKD